MYLFLAYSLEFPKKSFFSSTYSWQHDDAILVQVENRKVWSEQARGFGKTSRTPQQNFSRATTESGLLHLTTTIILHPRNIVCEEFCLQSRSNSGSLM